jgi:DNA-binding transcriptional LysR family regulator
MNLHHLRYFLAVARTASFTQAAKALHVTQPTVSNGIAELERSLGTRLFHRDGRQVELTMEGRLLVSYAVQVEDLLEEVEERLSRRDWLPGEGFRFGAIDAAVIYLLPEVLRQYRRDCPQVEVTTQVAPSRYLVDELLAGRSEFAVISLPYNHPKLAEITLCREAMPLVLSPAHALAERGEVDLADVAQEPLILFHEDSVSRRLVDERFAEAGVSPRVVMEMRSPEAMRQLVEAGLGISFLPAMTAAAAVAAGRLRIVPVRGVDFSREIGLAWRRGRHLGPAVRRLMGAICAAHGQAGAWDDATTAPRA